MKEQTGENKDEQDKNFVNKFLADIETPVKPTSVKRIGQESEDKLRPIKLTLSTVKDKATILQNLSKLKGMTDYQRVRVTEDYTIAERELIKSKVKEAKERNEAEPTDSSIVWVVRGSPKNGLRVKWLRKRDPRQEHQ